MIATGQQLTELVAKLGPHDRIAIDTEADSLHCYKEKLCLLQISIPGHDNIVDPLADVDLAPLQDALSNKEIVLHGADYDLRLLRRNLNFVPERIFDTVIAARLIGIHEFSLAAVVRELWNWREKEAEAVDRPPFHILQNRELLDSAERFAAGESPDYKHFSDRRRRAFREAAERGMQMPEKDWPVRPRRSGTRATAEVVKRIEQLRRNRDHAAKDLQIESSFIAPRATLEAIAADQTRADALLVPWQRELLGI